MNLLENAFLLACLLASSTFRRALASFLLACLLPQASGALACLLSCFVFSTCFLKQASESLACLLACFLYICGIESVQALNRTAHILFWPAMRSLYRSETCETALENICWNTAALKVPVHSCFLELKKSFFSHFLVTFKMSYLYE